LGYAVLIFIWVIPLLVLWSISFCFIRCKKDPARTGMVWIKIVYPLWLASSVLYTVQAALWAWYDKIMENRDYMIYDPMLKVDLEAAQFHTGELAMLLSRTADICLLVTLIELASGFIICLNEGSPPPFRKRIRYITFALASVLFILSVIVFALRTSHRLVYLNAQMDLGNYHQDEFPSLPYDDLYNHYEMLRRFDRAIRFLIWIASVATLVYVSYATHQTKVNRILRKSSMFMFTNPRKQQFISPLLACSILDMLRLLAISFFYPYDSYFFSYSLYIPTMLGGFVNYVFMFIILIILYCIGFRKSKGLWSTPQKWNTIGSDKVNEFPPTAPAGMSPFYPPPTTQEATQQPGMPWQPHQQTRPPSYNPQHPSFATQQPQEQQLPLYYPQTTQIQGHHHQQQPINPNPQHPPLLQPLEIPEPTYQQ
ncbi:hypothetical protein QBC38DRAFT_331735, partial [Podospora fimiseda]